MRGCSRLVCTRAGDEILCNADIYGGMYRLLTKVSRRLGTTQQRYDISNLRHAMFSYVAMSRFGFAPIEHGELHYHACCVRV